MGTFDLIGSTMGLGFIAGLRLYATVLALGLGIRFGWIHPGGIGESLRILAHPAVLTVAGIAFAIEFFADKVPWVDSLWDGFHTFIRPIGAAVFAAAALGSVDPVLRTVLIVLCGGVAFASHSSKAATRLVVNHSPEPFTNIALSTAEDLFVPLAVWTSLRHPLLILGLTAVFLLAFLWFVPDIFRSLRLQVIAVCLWLKGRKVPGAAVPQNSLPACLPADAAQILSGLAAYAELLPAPYAAAAAPSSVPLHGVPAAAAKRIKGLGNSIGYLAIGESGLTFVARRAFRYRVHHIAFGEIVQAQWRTGILVNRLLIRTPVQEHEFYIFKNIDPKMSGGGSGDRLFAPTRS
jgi:hypothetical protein